jgi:hypothetical protein
MRECVERGHILSPLYRILTQKGPELGHGPIPEVPDLSCLPDRNAKGGKRRSGTVGYRFGFHHARCQ